MFRFCLVYCMNVRIKYTESILQTLPTAAAAAAAAALAAATIAAAAAAATKNNKSKQTSNNEIKQIISILSKY